jgi:endoglucanase
MPKAEEEKLITIGDPITRDRQLIEMGECVNCKSIDNRVSVYILLETLRVLGDVPYDVYGVFTVQEEVGLRGALVASHHISPDFGFGLDTTIAYDVPGARPEEKITELGKGVAIKIMDTSSIADYRMVRYMKEVAANHNIKWQPEVLTGGGTDTAGMQRMSKQGVIAGAVSIPTRHIHQVIEMAHKNDIVGGIDLLKNCLQDLDKFDWSFS